MIEINSNGYSKDARYRMISSRLQSEGLIIIQEKKDGLYHYFAQLQRGIDGKFRGYTPFMGYLVGSGSPHCFRVEIDSSAAIALAHANGA